MEQICLTNAELVLETGVMTQAYLLLHNGVIGAYGPMDDCPASGSGCTSFDCRGKRVIPGMIDIHVHGAGGADVMDATPGALSTIARTLAKEGTTAFLATTMTNPADLIREALTVVADVMAAPDAQDGAELIGVHLEGPFISEMQKGAQPSDCILAPDAGLFDDWQQAAGGAIRIVTFAPEQDADHAFLRGLRRQGVIASIGHADATFAETVAAIEDGVTHATHFFNGMRGLHHREPGVVGACLLDGRVSVELIPDGHHFHPDLLKLVLEMKGTSRMLVITDGMRAKGMPDGTYDLGGSNVLVKDGKCTLEDGSSLAGSIVTMNGARRNVERWLGLTPAEQARVTSLNQAERLGIADRKGSLAPGKDADVAVLGANGEVALTICRGRVAYLDRDAFRA